MKLFETHTFSWREMGLVKICLISLGILLGLYFYTYLIDFTWLWWALFWIPAMYFIICFLRRLT